MAHSQTIEQTRLWQVYKEKNKSNLVRTAWTKTVCEAACEQLKAVRDTFSNYTLHDETHVLNVLDAMSGLLGNQIETLTEGETELLLLAAALHDLGMVYTDAERIRCLADKTMQRAYYNYRPSLRGTDPDDWNDSVRQDYLRWLHPFRVWDVLQQPNWQQRISNQPKEVVPIDVIVSVCRAHGETPSELRRAATELNGGLRFRRFMDVDPLFCAILLRLADILDFDDSRVPSVLFSYSTRSEKSVAEWKKHMGSMGFRYPDTPSTADLPYGAVFTDPTIERSARTFLDWIDDEFSNVRGLLPFTCNRWKNFPFPYQVDRSEIERNGYDFGDFHLSMDQEQIMELLIGEDLYPDRSVFVRELLQNSIDATLLRAKMDSTFEKNLLQMKQELIFGNGGMKTANYGFELMTTELA